MKSQSNERRIRFAAILTAAGLAAGVGSIAFGQVAPREDDPRNGVIGYGAGAKDLDARLRHDGHPTEEVTAALTKWLGTPAAAARDASASELIKNVPTVRITFDPMYGTPRFVRSTEEYLTPPNPGMSPRDVVRNFVSKYQGMFGIDAEEIRKARVTRDFVTEHNGVTHLTFRQQIGGVDIIFGDMTANVTRDGKLINIGGVILPRPGGEFTVAAPVLTAADAIRLASQSVGTILKSEPVAATVEVGASRRQEWQRMAELRPEETVVTEFVYFALTRDDIRPAWTAVIPQPGVGHTFEVVVDAINGRILHRWNRLQYATTESITFRIYTSDSPAPGSPGNANATDTFQFPFVSRQLVTVTPAEMAPYSPNGWIDDGGNTTNGNNVYAYLDAATPNNVPDRDTAGSSYRVFDFAQDNTTDPPNWQDASVAQLFYLANKYHDLVYSLGFNEAAGNFQRLNFGRGGAENDPVLAEAQDGSGTNNANFATPADGSSGRCQMYRFTGPTPDRDGSLDADIVYHELTHGTSIRCHGQGVLASNNQGGCMGEGWGDFFGLSINSEPGDDPDGVYPMAGYATYQFFSSGAYVTNYYHGIRRFPHTTDMAKNPLTYADIDPAEISLPGAPLRNTAISNTANQVHNAGEVWCATLWGCRANLVADHGFAGNELMLRLTIDGMKLDVRPPTMLDARDAIIQADMVLNNGANRNSLWRAFARRGMGYNAFVTPNMSSSFDVTENYDIPRYVTFSFPDGTPSQLAPNAATTFRVGMTPVDLTITAGTARLHYSLNGGAYVQIEMPETSPGMYTATIPPNGCFANVSYYISVGTDAGANTSPTNAPTGAYQAQVYTSTTIALDDTFETDQGWTATITRTAGTTGTLTGLWERVDPIGTVTGTTLNAPEDDHTPAPGVMCYVTQNGLPGGAASAADIDNGTTTLLSPRIDLAGAPDAEISYWRWYTNANGGDILQVQVSTDDGMNWTTVETVGNTLSGSWIRNVVRMSQFSLTPTANTRIRVIAADLGTGNVVEAGLDDVQVTVRLCSNTPSCVADVDDGTGTGTPDGGVTIDDMLYYLALFDSGNIGADVDDGTSTGEPDGGVTIDDLLYYLFRFDMGC